MNLKLHSISKLGVFALSIVLLTEISLVPTLQIGVQGQVQQQQSPLAPPTPGTIAPPSTIPEPPPEAIAPETTTRPPPSPPAPTEPTSPPPAPETTTRPPPSFGAAGEGAANQTSEGGSIVNQSDMVMIPLSTMQMIMSQLQDAMTAVDSNNKVEAMTALNSVDQELKSAANASGVSVENTTG